MANPREKTNRARVYQCSVAKGAAKAELPSLKLTANAPQKWMLRNASFLLRPVWPIFRGKLAVRFRECFFHERIKSRNPMTPVTSKNIKRNPTSRSPPGNDHISPRPKRHGFLVDDFRFLPVWWDMFSRSLGGRWAIHYPVAQLLIFLGFQGGYIMLDWYFTGTVGFSIFLEGRYPGSSLG